MPSLWDDEDTAMESHASVNNRNRNTNLSTAATSGGASFSTRDFSIDQSLNLMFGGGGGGSGEPPATNLSRADPRTTGTGDGGFASSVVSLFRASGSNNAPPVFDEYGDAAPSAESEEYISDKRRRAAPLMALIRGFIGTKYFKASVMVCILFGILLWTLIGPSRSEKRMKRYIVEKGISSANAFKAANSPQSLALDWVANQDPARLKPGAPGAVDRYILAVFYYGSHMQQEGGWKSTDNWMTGKGVCAWAGVQCIPKEVDPNEPPVQSYDANGSIIGFVLPSNGMEGTIPDEFASFPELMILDLSDNGISGTIPKALGTMKIIRNLILRQNSIVGTFPSELTALTQLYQLHLGENMLTGYIPDDIGSLTVLRTLSVSSNQFEGFFPYLEPCKKLVRIHVDNNKFGATLPAWLGTMADLKDLRANNNAFMGRIPTELQSTSDLEFLHLEHNKFTHKLPDIFNRLARLSELKLHRNAFTGTIPSSIYFLQGLKILTLDNNKFSGTVGEEIGLLLDAEVISLHVNQLEGIIPSQLGLLDDIQTLTLNSNRFSSSLPSELGTCFRLKTVKVDQNRLTGTIPKELGSLDHLQALSMEINSFSGEVPTEICTLKSKEVLGYVSADCKSKVTCGCCNQCL